MKSSSAAHQFRPQCLISRLASEFMDEGHAQDEARDEAVVQLVPLVNAIDCGNCPRCLQRLPSSSPASSSMVTSCGCVPVCGQCSRHEEHFDLGVMSWGFLDPELIRTQLAESDRATGVAVARGL